MKRITVVVMTIALVGIAARPAGADDPTQRVVLLDHTVKGTVEVPDNTVLLGTTGAVVIGTVVLRNNATIRNVEIKGWKAGPWNFSAGVMVRGNGSTVDACFIHDGPTHGIQVIGGYEGARLVSNRIYRVGAYFWTGADPYPVANWRGISLERGSNGTLVAGNTIVDAWENGVYETDSAGVVIRGNTILRSNRGKVDRWNAGSGDGIESLSDGTVVADNVVDGSGQKDVFGGLNGITIGGAGSLVTNNQVRRVRGSGIRLIHGGDGRVVEGNLIEDVAGDLDSEAGIRLLVFTGTDQMLGTLITYNTIRRAKTGVAVRTGPNEWVDFTTVSFNSLGGLRLILQGSHDSAAANT